MVGIGLYIRIALAAALFFAGMAVCHKVMAGKMEKLRQESADLRAANETFVKNERLIAEEGVANKAKLEQAAKDITLISNGAHDQVIKIDQRPLVGTGCEQVLNDQRAYFMEQVAAARNGVANAPR
jgi:hypothetical protein